MSTFPASAQMMMAGLTERFDPSVTRVDMERGRPKQKLANSQVLVELTFSVYFADEAASSAFEDWYFNDIKRVGEFEFKHPRTGAVKRGAFKGGDIGTLELIDESGFDCRRQLVVEYLR